MIYRHHEKYIVFDRPDDDTRIFFIFLFILQIFNLTWSFAVFISTFCRDMKWSHIYMVKWINYFHVEIYIVWTIFCYQNDRRYLKIKDFNFDIKWFGILLNFLFSTRSWRNYSIDITEKRIIFLPFFHSIIIILWIIIILILNIHTIRCVVLLYNFLKKIIISWMSEFLFSSLNTLL